MSLRAYLDQRRRLVNRALEQYAPLEKGVARRLSESMRYSLFAGGKRIRPILLLAATETVGGEIAAALPFACAIEMIHTYSLVHDDLPCMDDDKMRRGKPTNHIAYGESLAILAGDALLTDAFRVMAENARGKLNPRRALLAMGEIADAAGSRGMVAGQVADMLAEKMQPDLPTVEFIHVRKTGALLRASIRAGAMLGGARSAQLESLTRYGEFLGLAFQVVDDILDCAGTVESTGKTRGRDAARQKATFPAVMGLPAARQRAGELLDSAIGELGEFQRRADPLRQIARFVVERALSTRRGKAPGLSGT